MIKSIGNKLYLACFAVFSVLVISLFLPNHPPHLPPAFTPHLPPRALHYQFMSNLLTAAAIIWYPLGLWFIFVSSKSANILTRLSKLTRHWYINTGLGFCIISIGIMLWTLPLTIASHILLVKYGFSHEPWNGVIRDRLLQWLVQLPIAVVYVLGVALFRKDRKRYWLHVWLILVPVMFFEMAAGPVLIAPLFNTFKPLPNGPLRTEINALAQSVGIHHPNILVVNTSVRSSYVNAYVAGWGPTIRIVMDDNDLRVLTQPEIIAMIGHEMGHYVEHHVYILFVSNCIGAFVLLFAFSRIAVRIDEVLNKEISERVTSIRAIQLVQLTIYILLMAQMPIANAESRYLEHRADTFSLKHAKLNIPLAQLMMGFVTREYGTPYPPRLWQWWFGTHPSLDNRILFALTYR